TDACDVRDTDWSQVIALYDQLVHLDPSPIVRLNRAIAVAELDGPEVALAEIDGLPLESYHAFHATRADLLRRLGRSEEPRAAYRAVGGRGARRAGGRAGGDRRSAAGELPRLPRPPRRPAAPAGPERGAAGGLRPGHRAGRQHRRDGVPHPSPRPASRRKLKR